MAEVLLQNGAVLLVDDDDLERIGPKWHVSHNGYAIRRERLPEGRKRVLYMHREIMGSDDRDVDHVNGNRLDNRRCNLRFATRTENNANSKLRVGCTSVFKGVFHHKHCDRWWAYIGNKGKRLSLGYYKTEIDAARAYNAAALEVFGDFARLNPV